MLEIIYGKRGSGKTTQMIERANTAVKNCDGAIVFVDDDNRCMLNLAHEIRYINAGEYGCTTPCLLTGFICGIMAQDYDIEYIFVDGFPEILGMENATDMGNFISRIKELADKFKIKVILSISGPKGMMPTFMEPYIK